MRLLQHILRLSAAILAAYGCGRWLVYPAPNTAAVPPNRSVLHITLSGQDMCGGGGSGSFLLAYVTDASGAAVVGRSVSFQILAGAGSFSSEQATTSSYGIAWTRFTPGLASFVVVKASTMDVDSTTLVSAARIFSIGRMDPRTHKGIIADRETFFGQPPQQSLDLLERLNLGVTWAGSDRPAISLVKFRSNPQTSDGCIIAPPLPLQEPNRHAQSRFVAHPVSPFTMVHSSNVLSTDAMTISIRYTDEHGELSHRLLWSPNHRWEQVQDAQLDTTHNIFTVYVTSQSTPNLRQLMDGWPAFVVVNNSRYLPLLRK